MEVSHEPSDARWRSALNLAFALAVVLYLVLFGITSLTRTLNFSPDSMNYVDVARNITSGRGIVQSTLGFNQPHFAADGQIPSPFTSQPPLYPLLIALVSLTGLDHAYAALSISVVFYGLILLFAYLLTCELYDQGTALLSVALLLVYFPLRWVSSFAWSEPVGIGLVLVALWLLVRQGQADTTSALRRIQSGAYMPCPGKTCGFHLGFGLAGLISGLAVATRYALLPIVPLGLLLLVQPGSYGRSARRMGLYAAGLLLPLAFVAGRNLWLSGGVMGAQLNPSTLGALDNIVAALSATLGGYLGEQARGTQASVLVQGLLLCAAVLLKQRRALSALRGVLGETKRYALPLWAAMYLALLVYQRTRTHFDLIAARLISPAGVVLVLLFAALVAAVTRAKSTHIACAALIIASVAICYEARQLTTTPRLYLADRISRSSRLTWISQNTTEHDLIIGHDTMDVPFYWRRPAAVSFSPYPYTDYPDYRTLASFASGHCREFDHQYLVLRDYGSSEAGWAASFGPFITDIVYGRMEHYPGLRFLARLSDAYVFEFACP